MVRANILEGIHKKYIMYQLLKALKWIHSADVLHRDMKPSNLLLNSDCFLKVADFGLARSISSLDKNNVANPVLTDYVASRWYRAPEILLGSTKYTKGVDMWSLGCILGELLGGKPMFPGTSTMNQLDRIMEVTGRPSADDIEAIKSPFAATLLESVPRTSPRSLDDMFPHAEKDALDLLRQLLQFNPEKRITAEESLQHPFVAQFHNRDAEPVMDRKVNIPIDDDTKFDIDVYRDQLYDDIQRRNQELEQSKEKKRRKDSARKHRSSKSSSSGSIESKKSHSSKHRSSSHSKSSKSKHSSRRNPSSSRRSSERKSSSKS